MKTPWSYKLPWRKLLWATLTVVFSAYAINVFAAGTSGEGVAEPSPDALDRYRNTYLRTSPRLHKQRVRSKVCLGRCHLAGRNESLRSSNPIKHFPMASPQLQNVSHADFVTGKTRWETETSNTWETDKYHLRAMQETKEGIQSRSLYTPPRLLGESPALKRRLSGTDENLLALHQTHDLPNAWILSLMNPTSSKTMITESPPSGGPATGSLKDQLSAFNSFIEHVARAVSPIQKRSSPVERTLQPSSRVDHLKAQLSAQYSDFEAAAARACTAEDYEIYIKYAEDKLGGALQNLEDFIDKVTSGWLYTSVDYQILLDLIRGDISIWDYLKQNLVYIILVIIGLLVLITWLFVCLPKVCCRFCRRLCCCIPEKRHHIGLMSRIIVVVTGGVALVVVFVFTVLTVTSQTKGLRGVRMLQCHLYVSVREIVKGTDSAVTTDRFIGVEPLFDQVKELGMLLDESNPKSIVTTLRQQVSENLDYDPQIKAAHGYMEALAKALTDSRNNITAMYHTSRAIDGARSGEVLDRMFTAFNTTVNSPDLDLQPLINKAFQNLDFPAVNLDQHIPLDTMKVQLQNITNFLSAKQEPVSKGLTYTEVGFGVACGLVLLLTVLGAVWLVFFFCRGAKSSSMPVCVQWNLLSFCAVIFFLIAGILGFIMNVGMRGCGYINQELIVNNNWTDLLQKLDPGSTAEAVANGCLTKQGSGDVLAILGYRKELDDMLAQVDGSVNDLIAQLPKPPTVQIPELEVFKKIFREEGWVVVPDLTNAALRGPASLTANSRLHTYPEVLRTGLQLDDKIIEFSRNSTYELYGLRRMERLLSPWQFSCIRGEDPYDKFLITDSYPEETNQFFIKWLAEFEAKEKTRLEAEGHSDSDTLAEDEMFKMKNAIWWARHKHKILKKTFYCPYYDANSKQVVDASCSGQSFFAYSPLDWSKSFIVNSGNRLADSLDTLIQLVDNSLHKATSDASDTVHALVRNVKTMANGLNCKFIRRGFVAGTDIACNSFLSSEFKASVFSTVIAVGIMLWTSVLVIVWRQLKDNSTLKRSSKRTE